MKQQIVKRKRVLRWLRRECQKLPEQKYQAFEKFSRPLFTDPEGNLYTEEMEKDGVPRRMVWQQVVEHPVNHYRVVKKLYDKYGFGVIHAYFQIVGGMVPMSADEAKTLENGMETV